MLDFVLGALLSAAVTAAAVTSGTPVPTSGRGPGPASVTAAPAAPAVTSAAEAPARRLLSVDDLFNLKTADDPRLSPEGRWVAYTVSRLDARKDAKETQIYMVPAAGGEAIRLTEGDKPATTPRFSPDGRYLAFLSARDGQHAQVWLLDRLGGEAQRLTDFKADVADLAWSPDGHKLALVVADPDPDEAEPAASPSTSAASPVSPASPASPAPPASPASSTSASPASPKPIVIHRLQFKRDGEGYLHEQYNHLYVFDVQRRTGEAITAGACDDADPAWSPDGKWLAFTSNRTPNPDANENTDIFVVPAAPGFAPRAVVTSPGTDSSPVWSPDGTMIAYVEGSDPKDFWYGTSRIAVVSLTSPPAASQHSPHSPPSPPAATLPPPGAHRVLTGALDRNVTAPRFSADGSAVYFLVEEGGNSHLARVAVRGPNSGAGRASAPSSSPAIERVVGGERTVLAFDVDARGDVVVLESVPERPPEVSAVAAGGGLRRLTTLNDVVLRGLRLAPVERLTVKSADGTPVDVFLTRPPDAPAGARLPTILRIHGGPVSQYDTSFRFEWQLLAAHGYAVVSANPRGSAGYGRDFARAIWADWGNRDFQDLMAAVDHLVAAGIADPDRLGVGGWSYGGILTDYVITKTGRFKAAISGASETNFLADYGTDEYQYAWETELGLPWRNTDLWVKLSPWFQAEKITTPTLLLCGTDDANVPALNSEQLYQALRRLGRDTELVLYPGQTHDIRRPSFQKDRFERYLAWYDKYLKATAAASLAPAP